MDELQAAIVRVKLPHLDAWNERRRAIHRRYEEAATPSVRLVNTASPEFVGHLAVLEADDRDKVAELLGAAGVRTDVHYPVPDHRQRIMSDMEQPRLAVTERTAGSILSIPLFPELDEAEVDQVAAALRTLPA
jgi:dTDP-4-amino-4,6-dideoxygalactose transaminase